MGEEILFNQVKDGIAEIFSDGYGAKDHDKLDNKHPYISVEKSCVLQAARHFHDSKFVKENPQKCCTTIGQILYLQNSPGQSLSKAEATDIFFGVTKLFVCETPTLRRMVYLFIKEVCATCDPSHIIIVTSSLSKDVTCSIDIYRANALRVLIRVIDSAMLGAIQRYIKQSIVDKSSIVSSSALVSSILLFTSSSENASIIKRWVGEVQEALKGPKGMIQFHAIQLLYIIKSHDRLGVSKFVHQCISRKSFNNPLVLVCLIRFTWKLMCDDVLEGRTIPGSNPAGSQLSKFLNFCLNNKCEIVAFEAAKAICTVPRCQAEDMSASVSALKNLLGSKKSCTRLGVVKVLAVISDSYPRQVASCSELLEALVEDSNRLIGTFSITALLRIANVNDIDRLSKGIAIFLRKIADEYKIVVVRSLKEFCIKHPSTHIIVVGFLSSSLKAGGEFVYKRTIVNNIIHLMEKIPESIENSLSQLCEFIEDCEFSALSIQIIHTVGRMGPNTSCPAKYIRFIYNRVILENRLVRAAAVTALARFAAICPALRISIISLLKLCLMDQDDETRDRACVASTILKDALHTHSNALRNEEIEGVHDSVKVEKDLALNEPAVALLVTKLPISFMNLARDLRAYQNSSGAMESADPLSFENIPSVEDENDVEGIERNYTDSIGDVKGVLAESLFMIPKDLSDKSSIIHSIPALASFGNPFCSSNPVPLTEIEAEYIVVCIKHVFKEHIVLHFQIENTIEDQILTNVSVSVSGSEMYEVTGEIPSQSIMYGTRGNTFTILQHNVDIDIYNHVMNCELKFRIMQVNEIDLEEVGGLDEEYSLEDLEISFSDFISKTNITGFKSVWDTFGNSNEILAKFSLRHKNLEDALDTVKNCTGMQVCDDTNYISEGKRHMIHLSGIYFEDEQVLARAQISMASSNRVILKIAVRCNKIGISKLVAECFA